MLTELKFGNICNTDLQERLKQLLVHNISDEDFFTGNKYFDERQKKQLSVCIKHEQPAHTSKQHSRTFLQKQALTSFDSASITDIC